MFENFKLKQVIEALNIDLDESVCKFSTPAFQYLNYNGIVDFKYSAPVARRLIVPASNFFKSEPEAFADWCDLCVADNAHKLKRNYWVVKYPDEEDGEAEAMAEIVKEMALALSRMEFARKHDLPQQYDSWEDEYKVLHKLEYNYDHYVGKV